MHSAARPSASTPPLSSTSWSDTTNAIPLTSSPIHGALPAWSPDGSQIAFMGTPKGKSARIYLIARDGGEPKPVPPDTLWPLAPLASEHWLGAARAARGGCRHGRSRLRSHAAPAQLRRGGRAEGADRQP